MVGAPNYRGFALERTQAQQARLGGRASSQRIFITMVNRPFVPSYSRGTNMNNSFLSRRQFLERAAGVAAGLVLGSGRLGAASARRTAVGQVGLGKTGKAAESSP